MNRPLMSLMWMVAILLGLLSLSSLGLGIPIADEAWKPTHYELYSKPCDASVGYNKTLELIKKLNEIYSVHTTEETNGRNLRIANLLKASERNPEDCNAEYLGNMNKLLDYNRPFLANVSPYMIQNIRGMREFCERQAHETLRENVAEVGEVTRNDIELLVTKALKGRRVTRRHVNELWVNQPQLIEGIVEFLEEKKANASLLHNGSQPAPLERVEGAPQPEPLVPSLKSSSALDFDHYVVGVCDLWVGATSPVIALKEFGLHIYLSSQEADWLRYNAICNMIYDNQRTISKRVRRILDKRVVRASRPAKPGLLKALRCFAQSKNCLSKKSTLNAEQ